MSLRAGDKVENVEGRIGLVLSVRRDADCNCVAVAWDNHDVLLYSREEKLDVRLISRLDEGQKLAGQDFLPSAALTSLYTVPDPTNWLVFALIDWHRYREILEAITEHGIKTVAEQDIAYRACDYVRSVLDRMRGVVIDFTQN
jgi:hypothetical protein